MLAGGCDRVSLYNNLAEQEGNEMMALLLENGIEVKKTEAKEGVNLSIPKDKAAFAVRLLYSNGYPRQNYTNVNEIFSDSGLVTTDFERYVRFNYAVAQEISNTLSKIDGVIFARVHLSFIDNAREKPVELGQEVKKKKLTAAVFVKYNPEYNLTVDIPQIKLLVSGSISNLDYQDVSVSLSPSRQKQAVQVFVEEKLSTVPGLNLKIAAASAFRFYVFVAVAGLLILLLAIWAVYLSYRNSRTGPGKLNGPVDNSSG